jgi:hypothetical protein
MNDAPLVPENYIDIHEGIVKLLGTARAASVRTVNALMTATYWEIGRRIVDSEQAGQQRAEYGEALIRKLASDLTPRFGRGFGWRNLMQMRCVLRRMAIIEDIADTVCNIYCLARIGYKVPVALVCLCSAALRQESRGPNFL